MQMTPPPKQTKKKIDNGYNYMPIHLARFHAAADVENAAEFFLEKLEIDD